MNYLQRLIPFGQVTSKLVPFEVGLLIQNDVKVTNLASVDILQDESWCL